MRNYKSYSLLLVFVFVVLWNGVCDCIGGCSSCSRPKEVQHYKKTEVGGKEQTSVVTDAQIKEYLKTYKFDSND